MEVAPAANMLMLMDMESVRKYWAKETSAMLMNHLIVKIYNVALLIRKRDIRGRHVNQHRVILSIMFAFQLLLLLFLNILSFMVYNICKTNTFFP